MAAISSSFPAQSIESASKPKKKENDSYVTMLELFFKGVGGATVAVAGVSLLLKPIVGLAVALPATYVAYHLYEAHEHAPQFAKLISSFMEKGVDNLKTEEQVNLAAKIFKQLPIAVRVAVATAGVFLGFGLAVASAISSILGLAIFAAVVAVAHHAATYYGINVLDLGMDDKVLAQQVVKKVKELIKWKQQYIPDDLFPWERFNTVVHGGMKKAFKS